MQPSLAQEDTASDTTTQTSLGQKFFGSAWLLHDPQGTKTAPTAPTILKSYQKGPNWHHPKAMPARTPHGHQSKTVTGIYQYHEQWCLAIRAVQGRQVHKPHIEGAVSTSTANAFRLCSYSTVNGKWALSNSISTQVAVVKNGPT